MSDVLCSLSILPLSKWRVLCKSAWPTSTVFFQKRRLFICLANACAICPLTTQKKCIRNRFKSTNALFNDKFIKTKFIYLFLFLLTEQKIMLFLRGVICVLLNIKAEMYNITIFNGIVLTF